MTRPDPARTAALFGVPADADPSAVRAAVLGKLAAEGFTPPEEWAPAANDRGGAALPVTPDAVAAVAAEFRRDLDGFAAEYWTLPPTDRRARWEALAARDPDGPDAKHLDRLKAGLDLGAAANSDPAVEELAGLARELFVLRPRPRIARRLAWVADRDNATDWAAAATRLRDADPVTANLEPAFIGWFKPSLVAATAAELAATTSRWDEPRPRWEPPSEEPPENPNANRIGIGIGVAVVLLILSLCLSVGESPSTQHRSYSPDSPPPAEPAPVYVAPPAGYPPYADWNGPPLGEPFTKAQLESFKRYDPSSGQPAPWRYWEWRRMTHGFLPESTSGGLPRGEIGPGRLSPTTRR